ncbi:MFS transporter [Microbacterium sp. A8/3-1]|uniref:MFS transporter n=1 Tax=Microbacterium sp. A8/3-1 TaxID=3160749 RepID=A0AAU7W214_9MICO
MSDSHARRAMLAIPVLCLIQFVDVMGVTSATTAIPAILIGLDAPQSAAGPLVTTYAVFFGGLLVVGARLGDRFGHRRILALGVVGFALVSVIGGLAESLPQLLVARSVQGAAAAISVPCALRLLLHVAPQPAARRSALAAWSAAGAAAGAAGFVVGGVLVEGWGWPAVFWINAPLGSALALALLLTVPRLRPDTAGTNLDLLGGILLIGAVMLAVAGAASIEQSTSITLAATLIVAAMLVAVAFGARMRRASQPLISPAAFTSRNLRHGTLLSFVNTATTSSSAVLATLYLQGTLELSAVAAGLTLMTFSLLVVVGSAVAKPMLSRVSTHRVAGAGLGVIALGNLALVIAGTTAAGIAISLGLAGLGIGLASVAATSLGTDVPERIAGSASGILNTGAQLGTALGTAAIVAIAALSSNSVGWIVAAIGAATTALWAGVPPHRPRIRREETTA